MSLRWKIAQAAEIRWWKSYLKNKPVSAYLSWKRTYWETLVAKSGIALQATDHILDAGCGPAGIFIALPDHKVDAVDPLLEAYEKDIDHFSEKKYPNTRFFPQSLESFESDKSYDKIFCLNVINHVADLDLCFDKLVRMTKKDGYLIVSIDAHNHSIFRKIFSWIPGDILHPHQYNLEEYQEMLTQRGCQLEQSLLYKEEFFFNYYILVARKTS